MTCRVTLFHLRGVALATRAHGLMAFEPRFCPHLPPSDRLATFPDTKTLIQTGPSGRVPVPPEKRFLVDWFDLTAAYASEGNHTAAISAMAGAGLVIRALGR